MMADRIEKAQPTRFGAVVAVGLLVGAALTACTAPPAGARPPARKLIDLGTLGGTVSYATDVNEHGQVVGASTDAEGTYRAYLWEQGSMRPIGPTDVGLSSWVSDINNRGQVVGNSVPGRRDSRAFLWSNGRTTALPSLGGLYTAASAINDRGLIVGASDDAAGRRHAVLWEGGQVRDLSLIEGRFGGAVALNERGQVGINDRAFYIWDQGHLVKLGDQPPDIFLGSAGVRALNDRGTVVGNLPDVSPTGQYGSTVFVWRNGRLVLLPASGEETYCDQVVAVNERDETAGLMDAAADRCHAARRNARGDIVDLGTLGGTFSDAMAINDRGQVVGSAALPGDAHQRAVLWEDGRTVDLGVPAGMDDSEARAVNGRGEVAGYGSSADGAILRAFLSVPGGSPD
jgi:probable HAF family extracellular repeat protein